MDIHMAQNVTLKNGRTVEINNRIAWLLDILLLFHVENVLTIQIELKIPLPGSRFQCFLTDIKVVLTIFCLIFSMLILTPSTEHLSGSSRFFWKVLWQAVLRWASHCCVLIIKERDRGCCDILSACGLDWRSVSTTVGWTPYDCALTFASWGRWQVI